MEKKVGLFKYQRVNPNNLIIPKNDYEDLCKRGKIYITLNEVKKKCETRDIDPLVKLNNILENVKAADDARELVQQKLDVQKCVEDSVERKRIIKEAKDKLYMKVASNIIFRQGLGLSNALKKNEEIVEWKIKNGEDWKKWNDEQDKQMIEGAIRSDNSRVAVNKQEVMEVTEYNIKMSEKKEKEREEKRAEDLRERAETERLTREWKESAGAKRLLLGLGRKQLNLQNTDFLKHKEQLRQDALKLEAMEERENGVFIDFKKHMFQRTNEKKEQNELRDKKLRLILERTQDWVRRAEPERKRGLKLEEVYKMEALWRQDDDARKQKLKEKSFGLAHFWKKQETDKLAYRSELEKEEKNEQKARVQMDCEASEKDTGGRYRQCVKAREVAVYNLAKHDETIRNMAQEKANDKLEVDKMMEKFAEIDEDVEATKQRYMEEGRKQDKNVIPIEKVQLGMGRSGC